METGDEVEEELQEITIEEVREKIKRLKRKKAAGQDTIPNKDRIKVRMSW